MQIRQVQLELNSVKMRRWDIVFFDIDGTLVSPDHMTVSPRNLAALRAAREQGMILVPASGRCLRILPETVLDLRPEYGIGSNGASTVDMRQARQLFFDGFSPALAETALTIIRRHVDYIELFVRGGILLDRRGRELMESGRELPKWHRAFFDRGEGMFVDSLEEFVASGAPGLEKIALVRHSREALLDIRRELDATGQFTLSASIGRSMEVIPRGCSKGKAALALCRMLGIDPRRACACGDESNDTEMLRVVGCGAAMANGCDAAKLAADCIAPPYDEDGFAQWMEQSIL